MTDLELSAEMTKAFLMRYHAEWESPLDSPAAEVAGLDEIKSLGYTGGTNPVLRFLIRTGYLRGRESKGDVETVGLTDRARSLVEGQSQ